LLAALVGGLIVLTLVPAVAEAVPWPAQVALLGIAVALALSLLAHNRRLCERCIASLPLDAAEVAGRRALRFRVAHLFEKKLLGLCYLGTVAGCAFVYDHPVGRYAWALVQASLVYLLISYVTHQRLQPWCPHCRHGGEEQTTPTTPDPVSTHA
jgi:hypothetical protein